MKRFIRIAIAICLTCWLIPASPAKAQAQAKTIIDEWNSVQPPPPPSLQPATADPKTTALLVLDLVHQACNAQRRPRCLASLAPVHALLNRAREASAPVVYSLVVGSTPADILPDVAPLGSEPFVTSGTDKFLGTDLADMLHAKGIKTVIIVGTAAQGAVITTATEAALRGLRVIVPVDGVSSESVYSEQYTAWDLLNAPVITGHVVLTRSDMITF
jgi:nicotinamidase-related amidase